MLLFGLAAGCFALAPRHLDAVGVVLAIAGAAALVVSLRLLVSGRSAR
jgi:hypothetical protein